MVTEQWVMVGDMEEKWEGVGDGKVYRMREMGEVMGGNGQWKEI